MAKIKKNKKRRIKISNKDWYEHGSAGVGGVVDGDFYNDNTASHLDEVGRGIFNQVSFNVLENAAAQSKHDKEEPNIGYSHRTVMSSDEILFGKKTRFKKKKEKVKKQKAQKREKSKAKTITSYIILALVVVFFAVGIMYYSEMFGSIQSSSASRIVMNNIASNDIVLIRLDDYLSQNLDEARAEDYYIEESDLEDTKRNLEKCRDDALEIANNSEIGSDENYGASNAAEAAECRIEMLECGTYILKSFKKVRGQLELSDSYWNDLLDANDLILEADELSSANNEADLQLAIKVNQQAIDKLNSAINTINKLDSMDVTFDFSGYLNYATTRLQAAQASLASLQALAVQDTDTSIAQNNIYVEKESAAADLAEKIDSNPTGIIRTNYDLEIKPYVDRYKAARAQAAATDSLIRSYLKL